MRDSFFAPSAHMNPGLRSRPSCIAPHNMLLLSMHIVELSKLFGSILWSDYMVLNPLVGFTFFCLPVLVAADELWLMSCAWDSVFPPSTTRMTHRRKKGLSGTRGAGSVCRDRWARGECLGINIPMLEDAICLTLGQ